MHVDAVAFAFEEQFKALVRQAFGKPLKFPVWQNVRQHPRKVSYPERSFLRSALRDMAEALTSDMRRSVGEILP